MTVKRSKIRASARGQECQVRMPFICSFNNDETILAHLSGAGVGMKHKDILASYSCAKCHDIIDGRVKSDFTPEQIQLMFLEGMVKTQLMLIDAGLIILK